MIPCTTLKSMSQTAVLLKNTKVPVWLSYSSSTAGYIPQYGACPAENLVTMGLVSYPEVHIWVAQVCYSISNGPWHLCVWARDRVLNNCNQWSPEGCSAHLKFGIHTLSNEQLSRQCWVGFSEIQIPLQESPGFPPVLCHTWQPHLHLLDTWDISDDIRHQCVGS